VCDMWGPRNQIHAWCERCARDHRNYYDEWLNARSWEPCEACGRLVLSMDNRLYRQHVACSRTCRQRLDEQRRRTGRHAHERTCTQCEQTFTSTRGDARYCSPACRQRAYRRRRAT
jgi:hypothetical protein